MTQASERLMLALNQALLGSGVKVSHVQRNYRLNYFDAARLMALRDACFDALDALAATETPQALTCEWSQDEEDLPDYSTGCGKTWQFLEDGPVENKAVFCIYCGRRITLAPPRPGETR